MLRHGRAGVPMEVMGLMLGEFVDDYTVRVVDVFAMPQSGTGVSVEAVDPVFQTKMMDMLRQTGRHVQCYMVIGTLKLTKTQTRDSCGMVSFTSWFWLLAIFGRYQHATVLRAAYTARRGRSRRSNTIRQRQSCHRCLPINKPSNAHDGP